MPFLLWNFTHHLHLQHIGIPIDRVVSVLGPILVTEPKPEPSAEYGEPSLLGKTNTILMYM